MRMCYCSTKNTLADEIVPRDIRHDCLTQYRHERTGSRVSMFRAGNYTLSLAVAFTWALIASSGAQAQTPHVSAMLSPQQLTFIKDALQSEYSPMGWKVKGVSQPLAREIFAVIEVDDKGAAAYQDPNGNRVIFAHSRICPDLAKPKWSVISNDTDLLLLMFHDGKMIYPHNLLSDRAVAGCRFSQKLVKEMIEQGAIQVQRSPKQFEDLGPTTLYRAEIYLLLESNDKEGHKRHMMVLRRSFVDGFDKGDGKLMFNDKCAMLAGALYAQNVLHTTQPQMKSYAQDVVRKAIVHQFSKLSDSTTIDLSDLSKYGWEVPVVIVEWLSVD